MGKPCAMKNASTVWGGFFTYFLTKKLSTPGSSPGQPIITNITSISKSTEILYSISMQNTHYLNSIF